MSKRPVAAVILGAGKGTRMKSDLPKVLHPVVGRPMICHLIAAMEPLQPARVVVVTAPGYDDVRDAVAPAEIAIQEPALGTGHAVGSARDQLAGFDGHILVLFGDTPLVTTETMQAMVDALESENDPAVAVLGFRPDDPAAYGRLVTDDAGQLTEIVEFKEANEAQRAINLCNAGIMGLDGRVAFDLISRIGNGNSKGEYYLTDIVALARDAGRNCVVVEGDEDEVLGVNSRIELAQAEAIAQSRMREAALAGGVTMIAPDTVWFSHDTKLGRDVVIEPNVVFGPGVTVADNAHIKAFSHLEGASVAENADIGPYARLRPGADVQAGARIGNFVEVKKSVVEPGAKVNHLSYIGDARVGAKANVGAGTITCNYDGFDKFKTDIGAGAFIGSNTALVAPVKIGDGALVAAGSTIGRNVDADAMAITRAPQEQKSGWAARFRAAKEKARKA